MYKEFEDFEYAKYGGDIFEKYFDVEAWSLSKFFLGPDIKAKDLYAKQKKVDTLKDFVMILNRYHRKKNIFIFCYASFYEKSILFGGGCFSDGISI